jgi:hypothetical protein
MSAAAADSSATKTPDEFWKEIQSDILPAVSINRGGDVFEFPLKDRYYITLQTNVDIPNPKEIDNFFIRANENTDVILEGVVTGPEEKYLSIRPSINDEFAFVDFDNIIYVKRGKLAGGARRRRRKTRRTRRRQSRRHR